MLLDGRALSDAYIFKHDGKLLFDQDSNDPFTDPQEVSPPGKRLFAVIEQQFKEWLFHDIERTEAPDRMLSRAITTVANVRGFVRIASREEGFDAVKKVIPRITPFQPTGSSRKALDAAH